MDNDIKYPNSPRNGKALAGIILLAVGGILLIRQFDFFFVPHWLFTWPMWLIFWGFFIGARSNFRKPSSFILIALGIIFLINENFHGAANIIWPLAFIAFGLWMILRRHSHFHIGYMQRDGNKGWHNRTGQNPAEPVVDYTSAAAVPPNNPSSAYPPANDEYLDAVSVFGGVKKLVLSKNFKGGEIVNVFGGAEIDFTQADISGRVIIDITQIFGGTKIIVPSHWQVISDMAAVFAGIDDKRMKITATPNNDKILVLKGVSIFAGIDIRSY